MPALYSVQLMLKAENNACISPTQGHHAYALFLNLIRQSNPELSEKLHQSSQAKPFTLSSLQGKFKYADKSLQLIQDASYFIRLTFLNEETFCHFMDAVYQNEKKPLRLESAIFSVQQILVNPQDSPWIRCQSFEELVEQSALEYKIQMEFTSVTTFRSGGKRNILFPEPFVLFSSLLAKWQELSPLPFETYLSESFGQIALTSYKLETHILHFNGYQETGFKGKCIFTLGKDLTDADIKSLNTLADFAFYCGTGAKTTMGMGQTRRIYDKLF